MQHNIQATAQLMQSLGVLEQTKTQPFLVFIQEPYVKNNSFPGLSSSRATLQAGTTPQKTTRAAILSSPCLNAWMVPEFSSADVTTCKFFDDKGKPIYVVSAYLDITNNSIPPELQKVTTHCRQRGLDLLIACDSNAHSSLWGCEENNARGDMMEDFIFNQYLSVCNRGSTPTFFNYRSETIIDVTLASPRLANKITNWLVDTEFQFSDHHRIEFDLKISITKPNPVRVLDKGDWLSFQSQMDTKSLEWTSPTSWDVQTIEEETNRLADDINAALDVACPMITPTMNSKLTPLWWSEDLHHLSRKVQNKRSLAKSTQLETDHANFTALKKDFKKAVRAAKRESWQKFISDTKSPKEMAKLRKIMQGQERNTLGLLRRPNGTFSTDPEETINMLLSEHFPDSKDVLPTDDLMDLPGTTFQPAVNHTTPLFTVKKARHAIGSFGPKKAAGPDGFSPIILQNLGEISLARLCSLYEACLHVGYTAKAWRTSRTIFIPKPGKKDYTQLRSFRPISLTSFLFKGMEKIIHWELEEKILSKHPLSKNQHAFRRGYSTDSALSSMCTKIESAITRQQYALGVFLDISGAFDNVHLSAAKKAMEKRNFPPEIMNWYDQYLRNRYVTTTINNCSGKRRVVKGTPQGGILSPLLWNLVFDELLAIFDSGPVSITGFADDGGLLTLGIDPQTMVDNMQVAVDQAVAWGNENGLSFNPSKTVVVLFTRRYKVTMPTNIIMGGVEIPFSQDVKYLGITLDSKLHWSKHIKDRIRLAKFVLMNLARATGSHWGPIPWLAKWAFTGIVRPILTFGCLVWGHATEKVTVMKELTKLNRLAARYCAPVRRSTPTAGLEVILGLIPLDLFIQQERIKALLRTEATVSVQWDGLSDGKSRGHRFLAQQLAQDVEGLPKTTDKVNLKISWTQNYQVSRDSFAKGENTGLSGNRLYTDGSKIEDNTGAGFIFKPDDPHRPRIEKSFRLADTNSVFQAEVFAIHKGCEALLDNPPATLSIFSDSRAAIMALEKPTTISNTVAACKQVLNALGANTTIEIRWIKAHVGHLGNEEADVLAKKGTNIEIDYFDHPPPAAPFAHLKMVLKECMQREWNVRWQARKDCRQTKNFYPKVDSKYREMITLTRHRLSMVIQFVTGHNRLGYHENLVDPEVDPECRLCMEDIESVEHLITECPAIRTRVADTFLDYNPTAPYTWAPRQISWFLSDHSIAELMETAVLE